MEEMTCLYQTQLQRCLCRNQEEHLKKLVAFIYQLSASVVWDKFNVLTWSEVSARKNTSWKYN